MNTENLPDLGFDWAEVWTMIQTTGVDLGINVVSAIVIFFVGKWIVNIIVKGLMKAMQKGDMDITLRRFVSNLARMLLMLFVTYKVGDWIEGGGVSGSVEEVQILTTVLKTGDNKRVIIPNSQIMGTTITNYSANDTRRVDLVVGVSYSDDLDKVRKELESLVAADDRILKDPAVTIAVSALADSSVNFVLRPWVKTADYWGVYFDLTEAVKKRFDEVGISIPFPQQDVYIHNVAAD